MSEIVARIRVPLFAEQTENLMEAVRNGHLARGPHLERLSEALSSLFSKKFVVLTSNGFSALFAALSAAPAGRVVTAPASTCFAMVNAVAAAGREVAFSEMDVRSASLASLEASDGMPSGAVVVPDHFGIVAPSCRTARRTDAFVIEDAAQSFLSRQQVRTDANAIVLSFYPTKLMNGIDGGAVLTDHRPTFEAVRRFVSYADQTLPERSPRYNLGMTNVHAAFALGTLANMEAIRSRLTSAYEVITAALARKGLRYLACNADETPSRLIVIADDSQHRSSLLSHFRRHSIEAAPELFFVCADDEAAGYPTATQLVERTFSLPLHAAIDDVEIGRVAHAVKELS